MASTVDKDNRIYNIFINSANRNINEPAYNFKIYFDNDEIILHENEGVNVNVVSFSMLNSMYNVNEYSSNNTFQLQQGTNITTITIPYGNYNVMTLMAQLNTLLSGIITVSYNVATNTYTYTNITHVSYSIIPMNCYKLLGLSHTTTISTTGTTSSYVNMVNYQQVILRCPTFKHENCSMDNIQDTNNYISVSDILYWVNKQDVEPFKMINYKNEDCSTAYSYNILNTSFSYMNFVLTNELNQYIYDAPDCLIQLQIRVYDKDNKVFKQGMMQVITLLNEIYFALLNIASVFTGNFIKRKK